jgi:hypothetical protein
MSSELAFPAAVDEILMTLDGISIEDMELPTLDIEDPEN